MAAPLLDARGLRKTFAAGRGGERRTVQAVADVDIAIGEGETHGLVGESGSGKSTTGRILLRLIEPDAGTVTFRGRDLLALRGAELRQMRRHIQLIYQDPFSSVDPRYRARDIVAEPWTIHGLYDAAERRRRADELLARVGIDPSQGDRRPASFSGGQLQRIGIARALALEPSLIVCDEPVSALDVSVQGQILNLLMDLKRDLGIAYLFIAHDLAVVRHISDRVSVMYAGRIVETGGRDQLFGSAGHPYTRALLAATGMDARTGAVATGEPPTAGPAMQESAIPGPPTAGPAVPEPLIDDALTGVDPTVGCAFRARCPVAQAVCSVERPELVDRGAGHPVACHFPLAATSGIGESGEG